MYAYEEEKKKKRNYPEKSPLLMTKFKEFNDIRMCKRAPDLALVLEDGNPGNGQFSKGFDFGGLGRPSEKSIQFPTHPSFALADADAPLYTTQRPPPALRTSIKDSNKGSKELIYFEM